MNIMKKVTLLAIALFVLAGTYTVSAQSAKGAWTTGADFFNRYNWRGSDLGNSPVVQPTIKYVSGAFTAGAWGSYSTSSSTTATEADLFMTYAFKSGFSLTATDYYFPSEPGSTGHYFNYGKNKYQFFEISPSYTKGPFTITGNYFFANANNDVYLEADYAFKTVTFILGGGNQMYTTNMNFNICNIGISTTKNVVLTDKFTLPLTGKVILNPDKQQIFFVFGFTI